MPHRKLLWIASPVIPQLMGRFEDSQIPGELRLEKPESRGHASWAETKVRTSRLIPVLEEVVGDMGYDEQAMMHSRMTSWWEPN